MLRSALTDTKMAHGTVPIQLSIPSGHARHHSTYFLSFFITGVRRSRHSSPTFFQPLTKSFRVISCARNKEPSAGSTGNAAVRSSTVTDARLLIDGRDRPAVWRRLPLETAAVAQREASRTGARKAACRPIGPSILAPG